MPNDGSLSLLTPGVKLNTSRALLKGRGGEPLAISKDTLKAIIRDYNGLTLSESELKQVMVILEVFGDEVEKIRNLDLSNVVPACLPRADETGQSR